MKKVLVTAALAVVFLFGTWALLRWRPHPPAAEDPAAPSSRPTSPAPTPAPTPEQSPGQISLQNQASPPAGAPVRVTARPDAEPAGRTSFYRRKPSPATAPSFTPQARLLAEAETVRSSDGPPDAKGRRERVALLKVDFKYSWLRAVSSARTDPLTGEEIVRPGAVMVADHILVKLRDGATEEDLRAVNRRHGAFLRKALFTPGLYLVAFPEPEIDLVPRQVEAYGAETSVVAYAEPDHIGFATATTPDDPRFSDCHGLHNTGQTGGTADADIDAPEAWDVSTGDRSFVVGVIDTGIDYHHEDLADNMWTNPGEVPGNAIDDDGNGFVDDVYGWDFANDDNDPWDDGDHGTHVAGTIAGRGNNGIGVAGVCWTARIMALKWILGSGFGTDSDAVDCVTYATMMRRRGVDIRLTNNSWRNTGYSQSLYDALVDSESEGILFVSSAGNDSDDTDVTPHYPSNYELDSVISVASTTHDDGLSSFSNYGLTTVDLGAPGTAILSSIPNDRYATFNGTSMASPHVAGVAALIWSVAPGATFRDVRAALFDGVDPIPALAGRTVTGGRLNARRSLELLGLLVQSSLPAADSILDTPPSAFEIEFSDALDPSTLQASDLTVNEVPADAYTYTVNAPTAVTFTYTTSPVTAEGSQTMNMAAGAVARTSDGDGLKPWSATFRYDTLRLAVSHTLPADGATVLLPLTALRVDFNESLDPSSVGLDDLLISQGEVTGAVTVDVNAVEYTLANVDIEGALAFSLAAEALADIHGNPSLPYAGSLDLDFGTVPLSGRFNPVRPAGSLVYRLDLPGRINPALDSDAFVLDLDSGQGVTISIDSGSTLRPVLTLRDPSNAVAGVATAAAPGDDVLLQAIPVNTSGSWLLDIGAVDSSTGSYTLAVHLNAGREIESYGGPPNDTSPSAEDVDSLFLTLAPGAAKASVFGDPGRPPVAPPIAAESEPNDDGIAGASEADIHEADDWRGSFEHTAPGQYTASLQGEISAGNDGDWDFFRVHALPGDTLVIDLKGSYAGMGTLSDPYLYLYDSNSTQLAFNDDWNGTDSRIEHASFAYEGAYYIVAAGLGSATGTYTLEATTTNPLNGVVPGEDWFRFGLAGNEVADLVVSSSRGGASLDLYDEVGLVAAGVEQAGLGRVIAGFPATHAGAYFARVTGSAPYHLVVTRQTAFADGLGRSLETAQDITARPRALGRTGTGSGSLFALPLDDTSFIVELDAVTGEELRRIPAPEPAGGPDCLAFSGNSLFLYNAWGSKTLWELDPNTGAVLDGDPLPTSLGGSDGMTGLDGLLYILDFSNSDIAVFDPATDTVLRVMDIDGLNPGVDLVGGLAAFTDPDVLVATENAGTRILEIDPVTGLVGAEFTPGTPANGDYVSLEVIDEELYLGAYTEHTLDVFARDGTLLRSVAVPYGLSGLASVSARGGPAWFSFQVNTDDDLLLSTLTPGDAPLDFENLLDPVLALYGPDDGLVVSNDNGAADGRNAELTHTALSTGTYRVQVAPALESGGEYLLSVSGATGDPLPFEVAASQPLDGALLDSVPDRLVIHFNAPIAPPSLDAADLLVNGAPDALTVSLIDGDTVAFELPAYSDGTYTFSLPAGVLVNLAGVPLSAFDMTVLLDLTPPRVVSSSLQEGGVVSPTGLVFVARFSEPLSTNQLEISDLVLEGPVVGVISPTGFDYGPGTDTLTVTFPDLQEDEYTLTLRSGNGSFEDMAGHDLDGETPSWPIPPHASGDGVDGGDFSVHFMADIDVGPWPAPFRSKPPLGALVHEASMLTHVRPAGDTDRYVASLDGGQVLSVTAVPRDGMQPHLQVHAPDGALLGSASASTPGGRAVLAALPVATSGAYTVTVSAVSADTGITRLELLLNAARETEEAGSTANDTPAGAEELDLAATSPDGLVVRTAVAGSPAVPTPAPAILAETEPNDDGEPGGSAADLPYANDWSGSFAAMGGGRYHAGLDGEIADGADGDWDFFRLLASPGDTLEVALLGTESNSGTLSDPYVRLYDEQGTQIASDDDGGDGLESLLVYSNFTYAGSYYVVADSFGGSTGTYVLDATHTTGNLLLPLSPGEDWYRFDLAESEQVALVLGANGGGDLGLELYGLDAATILTTAEPTPNSAGRINGLKAPAPGTYYTRVTGLADYTLALLREAWFEDEPNDTIGQARVVPGEGPVVGHVAGGELGRLYVYDATALLVRELDPMTGNVLNSFASPAGLAEGPDFGLATSPDGLLVGGVSTAPIYLLNADTGRILRSLPNPGLEVSGIAYLNGEVFLITDSSGDITVIDYFDGSVLRDLDIRLPISECLGAYEDGLLSLLANLLIFIDPETGATAERGTLEGSGEGLGVIGDELFVAGSGSVGAFDLETRELNRILEGYTNLEALGADGGSESTDLVRFDVMTGDHLSLATATPGGESLDPENVLDPALELYDPSGALVASNDHSGVDGRNAALTHTAGATGLYAVRVLSEDGSPGEYTLDLSGATGPGPAFLVTASDPVHGANLAAGPASVELTFSQNILLSSVDAGDLTVNGVPATAVTVIDNRTVTFDLPLLPAGMPEVNLDAGAVTSLTGRPVEPFSAAYTVQGPRVIETSVQQDEELAAGPVSLNFTFDREMNAAPLDVTDVLLEGEITGPVGAEAAAYVTLLPTASVLEVTYAQLADDRYTFTLLSGDGRFEDAVGYDLDGEAFSFPIPTNVSGNGTAGGDFVVGFFVDNDVEPLPGAFVPRPPAGSLVYETTVHGMVQHGADRDAYTLKVGAGQTLTVLAPPGVSLIPGIALENDLPGGPAPVTSEEGLIQTVAAPETAVWTLSVWGSGGSTGRYEVTVLLNAAAEVEGQGGPSNDTAVEAQVPAGSTISVGEGSASRCAVSGSLPARPGEHRTLYREDFERGVLGSAWATSSSDPGGRIRVSDEMGAADGGFALLMDYEGNGVDNLNEAIWTVDLDGEPHAVLLLQHAEWYDEDHPFAGDFTGSTHADGVAISSDGVNWHPVLSAPAQPSRRWFPHGVDLVQAAAAAGMDLGSDFRIKLQQFDNGPMPLDGRGWDTLEIVAPLVDEDWYAIDLNAQQTVSVVVEAPTGTTVSVELLASDGTSLLASGWSPRPGSIVIDDYVVSATGTYFVRVSGVADAYDLVVTEDISFDIEPNSLPGDLRDVGRTGRMMGHVGPGESDSFMFEASAGDALELTASTPFAGPPGIAHGLMPTLVLLAPDGTTQQVAHASTGGVVTISHAAAEDGFYWTSVGASVSTGEYELSVSGATTEAVADLVVWHELQPHRSETGCLPHFVLAVSNQGPALASGVVLIYEVDPGMQVVSTEATQGTASEDQVVLWDIGTLAVGQSAFLDVGVVIGGRGRYVNVATVASQGIDPNPTNDVDNVGTGVYGRPPYAGAGRIVYGSPTILDPPADPDQNRVGESLDLDTSGGFLQSVNTCTDGGRVGSVYFNYDGTNLYVGGHALDLLDEANRVVLFLGLNTLSDDFRNSAGKTGAPGELNLLDNLVLETPMDLAVVLGDEYGDGTDALAGHGVFRLGGPGFELVEEARLAQFDGSAYPPTLPTLTPDDDGDRETDRWEAAIPWSSLHAPSGIVSVTSLHVAGVLVGSDEESRRYIYSSYLGASAEGMTNLEGDYGFEDVFLRGLSVGLPDRDGDGLPDWFEEYYGLDPDDDGTIDPDNGPAGDPDGDQATNAEELVAGTHPRDAGSVFAIAGVAAGPSNTSVTVLTQPGQRYEIEYRDGGISGLNTWKPFVNPSDGVGTWVEDAASPTNFTFVDDFTPATSGTAPTGTALRVYRVTTEE